MLGSITKTATWKQSQITIIGTIINGVLGAVFYILIARLMGPSDFGLLIISIAFLTLIADIVDLGTNTGLIRFVSAHLVSDKEKSFKFLKLGLEIKLIVWLIVLILGFYLSPFIAQVIFKKIELVILLRLGMVGVGGALLFSYSTSVLQAFQRYILWSFINITSNFFRLLLIILLFYSQQLTLFTGLTSYILLPFLGFSLTLLFLPSRQIFSAKNEFGIAREFFKFNSGVAAFTIVAAISSRLDVFLNTRLLTIQDIGIYGAASQLTQVIPQIVGALGVVAAPKFASFRSINQMLTYFKKLQLMALGLSLVILLAIPISFYAIPILYGSSYLQSIGPFIILLLAMIIFLISVPLHNCIIFYFGRPDIFVWVSIAHLFIIGVGGYFLITNFGVIGTSMIVLIGMLANLLLPLIWFIVKLKL